MKKFVKILINMFFVFISITTVGMTAFATQAEIPKTEYIRYGVTYRMNSELLEKCDPEFNNYLKQISENVFEEKPMIYLYVIETSLNSLQGFQETYNDGSKTIYLKVQEYWKTVQVFIHEMVHYKYDVDNAIFYKKNIYGKYKYGELMEFLTDEIAKREYSKITNKIEYKKAYSSEIFEKIINEDTNDILISLYKGEYIISNELEIELCSALEEIQNSSNFEDAQKAFSKIKEKLERCPKYGCLFINKEDEYEK